MPPLTKGLSYLKFICIYFIIIGMIGAAYKWLSANPLIAAFLVPVIVGGLGFGIRWCWKWFFLTYPFKIKETYENYDYYKSGKNRPKSKLFEPIRIWCINGEWHKDRINLHITIRRKTCLKYINLRFVKKKLFKKPQNIPEKILSIKDIIHPQEKYRSKITYNDDKAGGLDCYFNPPIELSKNNVLFFEIYPIINVPQKIKCKISLENSSGEEKRTFSRKRVIITNEII